MQNIGVLRFIYALYIQVTESRGGVKAKVRLPTCGQIPRLVGIASDFITFCGAPTGALDARRTTKSAFSFARRCGIRQKSGMYWRFALDWVPTRRGFVPPSPKCVRSRAIERAMRLCGLRFCGDEHSCPPLAAVLWAFCACAYLSSCCDAAPVAGLPHTWLSCHPVKGDSTVRFAFDML